jgi:hypothetical protein
MPMTVSRNSPTTNILFSTSRAQRDEERRHGVEVRNGEADAIEASYV